MAASIVKLNVVGINGTLLATAQVKSLSTEYMEVTDETKSVTGANATVYVPTGNAGGGTQNYQVTQTQTEVNTLANADTVSDLTVADDLTVNDDAAIGGDLTVTGTSTFTGAGTFTLGSQNTPVARTATADGTGTGTIAAGTSYVTVTSADANNIIILPAPVVGNVIKLFVGATGFELRSSTPASIAINGGTGASAESAIPANTLVTLTCTSLTTWVGMNQAANGTLSATEVAA